jgi:hypothetical protein
MIKARRYRNSYVEEFPSIFKDGIIYLEEAGKVIHTIAFICPCGCGDVIYLNLLPKANPRWYYKKNWFRKISIFPSIRRTIGCRSHFCIWRNRVRWVG